MPGGEFWLDCNELRSLLATLAARASLLPSIDGKRLNLSDRGIWQTRFVPGLKALFDKLKSGEIPVWKFGERPGFAAFYVGVDALEFLHRSVSARVLPIEGGAQLSLPLSGGRTEWEPVPVARARAYISQPRQRPAAKQAQLALALA